MGAGVVVVAVIVFLLLNSSGNGTNTTAQPPISAPAASSPTGSSTSSPSPTSASQTSGGAIVPWGPAGQRTVDFYSFPSNLAGGWTMLTPAAQHVYGTPTAFAAYWNQFKSVSPGKALVPTQSNNSDGSVNIQITLTVDGQSQQKIVTVVDSGGQLLLTGNTKLG
jgi:hypothetical protein